MLLKKVAIIGYGSIGEKHFKILKKIKSIKTIIIISKRNIKINPRSKKILLSDDINFLKTEKPDIAFICSPASDHLNQLLFVAKLGIHIFIEKPLTNYEKISNDFLNILKNKKLYCFVGYVFKYKKILINLKKLIAKEIQRNNNPLLINSICTSDVKKWRKRNYKLTVSVRKKLGGGVINELSHEIHYLIYLFSGLDFYRAIKLKNLEGSDVESEALIQMQDNKKKIYCNLYLNYNSTNEERKCEIFFKKKKIIADFKRNIISIFIKNKIKKIKFSEKKDIIYSNQIFEIINTIKLEKNIIKNHNQFKLYDKINNLLININH